MQKARQIIGGLGNLMFKEAYIYAQMRRGEIPDIYVQNEDYFKEFSSEIKQRFGTGIGHRPYVAIHVRRGDYVGSDFHTNLTDTDYYDRAIELFHGKQFVVFSDDPEWCKQRFDDETKFQIVEGNDEIEDFNMMASCENMIIANSSFSWWAAYVNPNWNKRIIAPREETWYRDGIIRTHLPKEYEQI